MWQCNCRTNFNILTCDIFTKEPNDENLPDVYGGGRGTFRLAARADVSLTKEDKDGGACYRLDNGRVSLVVDPSKGGRVTSYKDRLGGDVELVTDPSQRGLCIDHFQSQEGWPGELFDAKYEVTDQKSDNQECLLVMRYNVTGQWRGVEHKELENLVLRKTYTLAGRQPGVGMPRHNHRAAEGVEIVRLLAAAHLLRGRPVRSDDRQNLPAQRARRVGEGRRQLGFHRRGVLPS